MATCPSVPVDQRFWKHIKMPMIWVHEVPEYELAPLCLTVITCIKDFEYLEPGNSFEKQIN